MKHKIITITLAILILGMYSGFNSDEACKQDKIQKTLYYTIEKPFLDPAQYGYWIVAIGLEEPRESQGCKWMYENSQRYRDSDWERGDRYLIDLR